MGGVDNLDQNVGAYINGHRGKKWWWPIFLFALVCQSKMLTRFIAIKKYLFGKRLISEVSGEAL